VQTTLNALALILIYQPNVKKIFCICSVRKSPFFSSMNKKIETQSSANVSELLCGDGFRDLFSWGRVPCAFTSAFLPSRIQSSGGHQRHTHTPHTACCKFLGMRGHCAHQTHTSQLIFHSSFGEGELSLLLLTHHSNLFSKCTTN